VDGCGKTLILLAKSGTHGLGRADTAIDGGGANVIVAGQQCEQGQVARTPPSTVEGRTLCSPATPSQAASWRCRADVAGEYEIRQDGIAATRATPSTSRMTQR
jgi:hypothetical protein